MKDIKLLNGEQFISDLKKVSEFLVYAPKTRQYFKIRKSEVLEMAAIDKISYRLTDEIYVRKRLVMVIT